MNNFYRTLLWIFPICLLACASLKKEQTKDIDIQTKEASLPIIAPKLPEGKAKNIILLIGDGMGLAQITASMYSSDEPSVFTNFKHIGLQRTCSADSLTTDSAAAATAFACGVKTKNKMIGMDSDSMDVQSILMDAKELGKKTGLVVTSIITHATPAAFYAHEDYRYKNEEIAADLLDSEVDFFIGGGMKYFNNRNMDSRNLYEELEVKGYEMGNYFNHELQDVPAENNKKFGFFTSYDNPLPQHQGRDYLQLASEMAIDHLENEDGYFLMIESSQIDWGGHDNILHYILTEMDEFEEVIKMVLAYAETEGETLVIVTGDHETGGLAIDYKSIPGNLDVSFSSTHHSAILIPVFAYGPGASEFAGMYENTEIYHKMRKVIGGKEAKK